MKYVALKNGLSTEHKTLGEINVPVDVPQVENLTEASSFLGGDEQLLEFINKMISRDATNAGRIALRAIPDGGDLEAATPRIQQIVKGFSPVGGDGRSERAEKVKKFDALSDLIRSGKELDREALLAMLEGAK